MHSGLSKSASSFVDWVLGRSSLAEQRSRVKFTLQFPLQLNNGGGRFTKHVGEFLQKIFDDDPLDQKQLRLKNRASVRTETFICASRLDDRRVLLAGRNGILNVLDVTAGKIADHHSVNASTINCLAIISETVVAGCDSGIETINPSTLVSLERDTVFTEQIVAIALMPWGIVSGTRDGILRRWSIATVSLGRYGSGNLKAARLFSAS